MIVIAIYAAGGEIEASDARFAGMVGLRAAAVALIGCAGVPQALTGSSADCVFLVADSDGDTYRSTAANVAPIESQERRGLHSN